MITLPELPPCPRHPDGQNYAGFASCRICWQRFYFTFDHQKDVDRINRDHEEYLRLVEEATGGTYSMGNHVHGAQ